MQVSNCLHRKFFISELPFMRDEILDARENLKTAALNMFGQVRLSNASTHITAEEAIVDKLATTHS